ncbi:MAG TPA: hypothetical protein PLF32_06195 [Bacteroidales bacterium]|nr:hypothetical protein [Bacteroidales bacterium]HOR82228.1 hypothetical protein [Bacteroidales bacterium]HPJ91560.1 hypothetical protein [Bacteroidales bacterium]
MTKNNLKIFTVGLILIITSLLSSCQSRQEKTKTIIKEIQLIETFKTSYHSQIETIKHIATGNDSIKIIELEKRLTDDEIAKRIESAFNQGFSDKELNDIYNFTQTNAFKKILNSNEIHELIISSFKDIDKEIEEITNNLEQTIKEPIEKFEPIPIDYDKKIKRRIKKEFQP